MSDARGNGRVPVTLLVGYLGAGKTSTLRAMARELRSRAAAPSTGGAMRPRRLALAIAIDKLARMSTELLTVMAALAIGQASPVTLPSPGPSEVLRSQLIPVSAAAVPLRVPDGFTVELWAEGLSKPREKVV